MNKSKRVFLFAVAVICCLAFTACKSKEEKQKEALDEIGDISAGDVLEDIVPDDNVPVDTQIGEEPTTTDPYLTQFGNLLSFFGYSNIQYSDDYCQYAGWPFENYTMMVYDSNEEALKNDAASEYTPLENTVLSEVDFHEFIPAHVVTYTHDDRKGYDIVFDKYMISLIGDYEDRSFEIAQQCLLQFCGTLVDKNMLEGVPVVQERPIKYEVEPEDTTKVYRLSGGTNVNTFNNSVFHLPAVPGLIGLDYYDDEAPINGETKQCISNRIYFKNAYGDIIMMADYHIDYNGSPKNDEPFDFTRVTYDDVDFTSMQSFCTDICDFNIYAYVRDYEAEKNADLTTEAMFLFPTVRYRNVNTDKYSVEYMTIIYRCGSAYEAFEFIEQYLADGLTVERKSNATTEEFHDLAPVTKDWNETWRNNAHYVPHVEYETINWRDVISKPEE